MFNNEHVCDYQIPHQLHSTYVSVLCHLVRKNHGRLDTRRTKILLCPNSCLDGRFIVKQKTKKNTKINIDQNKAFQQAPFLTLW